MGYNSSDKHTFMLQLISMQLLVKQMIHVVFIMMLEGEMLNEKPNLMFISSTSKHSRKESERSMNAGFSLRLPAPLLEVNQRQHSPVTFDNDFI